MVEFEGKTALVTGASRSIGESIARDFISRGVFVIGASRSNPSEDLQKEINKGNASYEQSDLLTEAEKVIERIYDKWGGFEIFVNNAGVLSTDFLTRLEPERIANEIKLDLVLPILMHRQWLKQFSERDSVKTPQLSVNICSVSSLYAWPGGIPYQASKTGLAATVWAMRSAQKFLRASADKKTKAELGNQAELNIRYLAIYPDSVDTGMINKAEEQSLYKIHGDFLSQSTVVDVIMKAIEGDGDWGKYDDIAILANPNAPKDGKQLKGVYVAFLPMDQETQRPAFNRRVLKKIAGEEKLIKRP